MNQIMHFRVCTRNENVKKLRQPLLQQSGEKEKIRTFPSAKFYFFRFFVFGEKNRAQLTARFEKNVKIR